MKDLPITKKPLRINRLSQISRRELVLLAPSVSAIPGHMSNVRVDAPQYEELLHGMQRLRGTVYLEDCAIRLQDLFHQRHRLDIDQSSWHLLIVDSVLGVCGCARYREHPAEVDYSQLCVSRSALARCAENGKSLRSSVEDEIAMARRLGMPYVELGGWALDKEIRCTTEALRLALSTYSLAQTLGGGVGLSTATFRNSSAPILRRLGGKPLECERQQMPSYFDPQYGCEMEVLRFYSWAPDSRYASWVTDLKRSFHNVRVVTNGEFDSPGAFRRFRGENRSHGATVSTSNYRSLIV